MTATSSLRSVYLDGAEPPEDLIAKTASSANKPPVLKRPAFGLDSVAGLLMSNIAAPLYLHASLSGKFAVWDGLLAALPDRSFGGPSLDLGCGRGMVVLKVAERKKQMATGGDGGPPVSTSPAYAIDIFDSADQTGNSPTSTYQNVVAAGVQDYVVLHAASFSEKLPFADGAFTLITTSLAIHNVPKEGRENALREMWRVCAPGGRIIIVDLFWHFGQYEEIIKEAGFDNVDIRGAGIRMMYGVFPSKILTASKSDVGLVGYSDASV